jgi:two-component system, OmpR family, sensor kinase
MKDQSAGKSGKSSQERFFHDIKVEFLIHEMKDPMAVIETALRSVIERQERYGNLTHRQEKTLQRALRSSRKLREMLRDLLEIGRSQEGCFWCSRFNPAAVAEAVIEEALETHCCLTRSVEPPDAAERIDPAVHGIRVRVTPAAAAVEMTQDLVKFRQILANLLKNALYHRQQWVELHLRTDDRCLVMEVLDDGPGIAPEHHQAVFRRYTQLEEIPELARSGHGLGLAGARILARCLGGDITIQGEQGKGAIFVVRLPLIFAPDLDGNAHQRPA